MFILTKPWLYSHFCGVISEDESTSCKVFVVCCKVEQRCVMEWPVCLLKSQKYQKPCSIYIENFDSWLVYPSLISLKKRTRFWWPWPLDYYGFSNHDLWPQYNVQMWVNYVTTSPCCKTQPSPVCKSTNASLIKGEGTLLVFV